MINTRFLLKDKLEGIGFFTHEICRRLVELYPNDEFIFCVDRPLDPIFQFPDNVKVINLFPPARHPFLFYAWFEMALPRAFRKYRPDVFFSPDGFCSLSKSAPPTLLTIHDLAYLHFPQFQRIRDRIYYRKFQQKFAHKAAHITTVSKFSKKDIMDQFGISSSKVSVVYNGPKSLLRSEKSPDTIRTKYSQGYPYFFYVGALHPRKNIKRMIEAFDDYKENGSPKKLLIAGRKAWLTADAEEAYQSAKHKADITFLDYVDEPTLADLMHAADALLYVSLFEGFGMPVLDAMQIGLPVITSTNSPMAEILNGHGYLADPNSIRSIVKQMALFDADYLSISQKIKLAKRHAGTFRWDESAEQIGCLLFDCN